jgi:2,4-dienoyl-CoA reductase (NADPH2)
MGLNRWLGCIENPAAGRESEGVGQPRPVAVGRRVLVIGAGPAGLQAALAAARNGHHVTVVERSGAAGGQVRLAATVPNRAEFGDLIRNQLHECGRLGVEFEFGVDVDADEVERRRPDTVVVATGSVPDRPWWAPADAAWIVDVRDVLEGTAQPTGSVLVLDELGFHHATSVAELLADRGCSVEVVSPGMVVGQDLGITLDLENWWIRAESKGIAQSTELVPMGVEGRVLNLQHHPTGAMETREPDWVVLAVPSTPADALFHELRGRGLDVARVGDAVAPRRAHAAVIDGERVGAAIPTAQLAPQLASR